MLFNASAFIDTSSRFIVETLKVSALPKCSNYSKLISVISTESKKIYNLNKKKKDPIFELSSLCSPLSSPHLHILILYNHFLLLS